MPRRSKLRSLKYRILAGLLASFVASSALACEPGVIDLRSDSGKARFKIEIADDDSERAQGLMHVESMPRFEGMLFIYERPLHAFFWMKNTLIPLDMLFIDPSGVVTHIHENATPLSLDTIDGGENVLAVLEINGGLARSLGLGVGTEVRHPAFAASQPVWPCEN